MEYLTPDQIEQIKQQLLDQKSRLVRSARQSVADQLSHKDEVPADSVDVSTGQSIQVTEFRLRDREKYLLNKIEKALNAMDEDIYGYCKECDGEIGFPRLKARPVAELCIECKEDQEHQEKQNHKPRRNDPSMNIFK